MKYLPTGIKIEFLMVSLEVFVMNVTSCFLHLCCRI